MISAINNVLSRGFTSFELLLNVSFILIVCLMIYIFYWHSINRSIAKINRCKINLNSGGGIYSMYAMYDQTKLYKVKYDNTTKHNVTIDCSCPAGNVPNTFKIKAYNGETDKIETVNKYCTCDKFYNADDNKHVYYNGDDFLTDFYKNNRENIKFPTA
jgi:hypothetical protein